ncbi:MAG TPA: glycosyltransferase [Chitinophagales bacterium]|nr:glycosyltransferase [Chitinophagales bacterium]
MKKITQVLYSGLGGHGSVAFSIMEGDIHRKCQHQFVFFGVEPVKEEYIEKCEQEKAHFDAVIINDMPKHKALYHAFKSIKNQKPDTVILHSITLFPIVPLLRLLGIKVISVDHTPNTTKSKTEWLAIKMLKRFSNTQVFLTKEQYQDTQERLGDGFFKKGNAVIINNGIDTNKFKPSQSYQLSSPIRLMMLARFSKTKDFQSIIRAVNILKNTSLPEFHVYFAGDGETFEECKNLAKEISVDHQITFLGMQPENVLLEYLQQTHLYIHSSLSETMSTAIMQALSCGLPCLVSDIPGNKALIKNQKNGWLFETQHPEDLAEKIQLFLQQQLSAPEMSNNARRYAEDHLSMVKMFDNYYKFI